VTFTGRGSRVCPRCGRPIDEQRPRRPGRPRRWCSSECRRAASEERRAAESGAIAIRYIKPDVPIEDHVRAVLGSPAACRRVLRELGERAARGELLDGRWTSVLSDLEHLPQPQNRTLGGARRGR
jgi:endogenous inhibitor of DNA gyrase (YacG/DUF329 family)